MCSTPRTRSEPMASAVMAAVMVCPGSSGLQLEKRPAGAARSDGHDHRLANRSRDSDDQGRHDSRDRGRHDDAQGGGPLPRAEPVADASRRYAGTACMASSETDAISGVMSTPTAMPAAAMFESGASVKGWITFGLIQVSAKKPKHHAWDRGQDFEDRLQGASHARGGVLGQVDPGAQAERRCDQHGDSRDHKRSDHDRLDVEQAAPREPAVGPQARLVDVDEEGQRVAYQAQDDRHADERSRARPRRRKAPLRRAPAGVGRRRSAGRRRRSIQPSRSHHPRSSGVGEGTGGCAWEVERPARPPGDCLTISGSPRSNASAPGHRARRRCSRPR